ncbi:hypothetical protein DXG01_002992 [Tephrocybe rancida]|nr:hypothetical protein DXG01_002992 [Tephrocybe rancida]
MAEVVKRQRRLDKGQDMITQTPVFASALKNASDTPSNFPSIDGVQQDIDGVQDDEVIMNTDKRTKAYVPKVQIEYLESFQHQNDSWEQTMLRSGAQGYKMSQGCPKMQNDIVPDEELIAGEVPVTSATSTLIADNPGIDDIPNNHRFGIIAERPDGDSPDAAYIGRLEEQFHRVTTLGEEAMCEMDLDTMDDAEDDDQLESDDPKVIAPIPLLRSGIDDHQQVPTSDALNNSYVRVVHVNGVHHTPLMQCGCRGEAAITGDLVAGGLLPTSFSRFRTFFTTAVLDDFRLSNLECKSLAYQYWSKISRAGALATSSLDVDDFYQELRRLSQSWCYVKKLIWSGFAQDCSQSVLEPELGELALFCLACPQHTINLPENWRDIVNQNILMRSVVADGNFKADHVRQLPPKTGKESILNIWLGKGGQFMTPLPPYLKYLKEKQNSKPTKAPCENQFRVLEQAMLLSKACDIKGIVALACARHGCFIPTCVADLPAGEQ